MKYFGSMTFILLLTGLFSTGCSNPAPSGEQAAGDAGTNSAALTYYKNVKPILEKSCVNCHVKGGIGPFDFTDYKSVHKYRTLIKNEIQTGKMPPWKADSECNTYAGNTSLPKSQIETISKWVDLNAPMGQEAEYKPVKIEKTGLPRVDHTLKLPIKYTPKTKPDDYRCFLVDWDYKETTHITGFRVNPDNKELVHHVIAYKIAPKNVKEFEELDKKAEGPGYPCYGGPGGTGGGLNASWIGSWAPGSNSGKFPKGLGLKIEPGSKVVLQMHYYTASSKDGASDQSSIEFMLDKKVEKVGTILPFTNPSWLAGSMKIPSGEKDVKHSFAADLLRFYNFFNRGGTPAKKLKIYTATLHMHQLGTWGEVAIQRKSGKKECLLRIPKWDFNWQGSYRLNTPTTLTSEDKIMLSCKWDNSAENQPVVNGKKKATRDVKWGDGTNDEMCLGVVMVAPEE